MVDEFEKEGNEKTSIWSVIFGFILTLILIPILFVGTCVPITTTFGATSATYPFVVGYMIIFCILCIFGATKSRNIGIRIAVGILMIPPIIFLISLMKGILDSILFR